MEAVRNIVLVIAIGLHSANVVQGQEWTQERYIELIKTCSKDQNHDVATLVYEITHGVHKDEYGCVYKCLYTSSLNKLMEETGELLLPSEMPQAARDCVKNKVEPLKDLCEKAAALHKC